MQEISCTQPYHRISFNQSNCYDSYFHQSCIVEKIHIEGKWNCHCPSFSRCDEPGFRENIKYIEISQKICGNECGSWISWSQPFSGEGGEWLFDYSIPENFGRFPFRFHPIFWTIPCEPAGKQWACFRNDLADRSGKARPRRL